MTTSVFEQNILNFKWKPVSYSNYKVFHNEVPSEVLNPIPGPPTLDLKNYKISFDGVEKLFSQIPITLKSRISSQPYMQITNFYFADYITAIKFTIYPTNGQVFGLGQRNSKSFFLQDGIYTVHGVDQQPSLDNGDPTSRGVFGFHPFLGFKHNPYSYMGIFFLNSNPQDWIIKQDGEQT